MRYVGRNAILPLFTQLTISIGFIVGGSFLVEPIFQYQGIGYTLFKAVQSRDYPLLQGIFLMITVSVVAGLTQPQLLSLVLLALGGAIVAARRNAPQAAAVA